MKKLLVIDDDRSICRTLELHLGRTMHVFTEYNAADGLSSFERESPDVVILDIRLPDLDGLEVLTKIKELDPAAYVIIITAFQDMETTIDAIKKGAFDYISKPINLSELELSIKRALKTLDLDRRLKGLLDEAHKAGTIVAKSRSMEEIFKSIAVASQSKTTTLIQGESGTGKELIARAIHFNSPEKDKPFVTINCSALAETLLESELFGHEKGAFTGAIGKKIGKFESANGGTIFLDEVGEMSPALQVKLLRVLQEKTFDRVGGNETIKTDIRIVAATNKKLDERVKEGAFRDDLYYRLRVITIDVPPLRKRRDDIALLVSHFLAKSNHELHKNVCKVPGPVMDALTNYPWPGNVRELENVITRAVLLAKGDVLLDTYLPGTAVGKAIEPASDKEPASLDEIEKAHISKTLEYTDWNKSRAASILGVSIPRLLRKIKKYDLDKDRGRTSKEG